MIIHRDHAATYTPHTRTGTHRHAHARTHTHTDHSPHSTLDRAFSLIEDEVRINELPKIKQRENTTRASLSIHSTDIDLEPNKN